MAVDSAPLGRSSLALRALVALGGAVTGTEVGGCMDFGARRVMGIGLGLLALDTVSQFKAVVAHKIEPYLAADA